MMTVKPSLSLVLLSGTALLLSSCGESEPDPASSRFARTDALLSQVAENVEAEAVVTQIDHARLAAEQGVEMPPAVVTFFLDGASSATLLEANRKVGLDLPHRVLCYEEVDGDTGKVSFASGDFLSQRHGLGELAGLADYDATMTKALAAVPAEAQFPVTGEGVSEGFGIVEMTSTFGFQETIERLKFAVLGQGDTVWFGEVDFQEVAGQHDVEIPPSVLLLFGGPGPGGQAMKTAPRLGLDAFCQKLLVLEDSDSGEVTIYFNRITDFAKLHYGTSTPPQQMIDQRLEATFSQAVSLTETTVD